VEGCLADDRIANVVGILDPAVGLLDLAVRRGQGFLGDLDFAQRDDLPLVEVAPDLDHLGQGLGIPLVGGAHALEARDVLAGRADDLGGQAVGLGLPR
jgi:hypothetical protein